MLQLREAGSQQNNRPASDSDTNRYYRFEVAREHQLSSSDTGCCAALRSVSRIFALLAGIAALIVLIGGWIFDSAFLKTILPGAASMKVNTSLCLLLASSAILLERGRSTLARHRLAQLCAVLVILISALTLIEHLSGWSFGIDELLIADRSPALVGGVPGRMAVIAAASILLLGCALLLGYHRRGLIWQQLAALVVAVSCLSNVVGYLYGIKNFTGVAFYTSTAVHTALALLLLSLAVLFARPDRGLMSLVSSESLAGNAVRHLLPAAVLVPLFLGWLTLQAELRGLNGSVFSLAVFATANVVVFAYVIWTGGRQLSVMETGKHQAEESFRLAFEAAPSGMIISDRDGIIGLVNSRAEELFGYSRDELLGNSIEMLMPQVSRELHVEFRREFFLAPTARTMGQQRDIRARRKDGGTFLAEIGLNPIETMKGTCVLSSVVDVTSRRRTEEERQRFVSLADRSLEFIGMCGLDFEPFYVNSAGLRLVGLDSLEAARKVKIQDLFFPEDLPFVNNEFFARALREGHGEVEIRFRHFKTGAPIWMLFNVFNIFDSHGALAGWATVCVNITGRKEAENSLREALQQLQLVTDNMPAAVVRYSRDLRYVWASRTYFAWLGLTPQEFIGKPIVDVLGQEGYEILRPHIETVLSGRRDEFETPVQFLQGGERWVHAVYVPTLGDDDEVAGWVAVVADVTDRHAAEERLRESEERFRAAFFQAAVGIAQTSLSGQWKLLNDRLCEILGYSRDDLLEKTFIEITHPDDRAASLEARDKLISGEISSWSSEKRYIRKDGATVWARLFVSVVRNQNSEPLYFVSVVEDITEKVQALHLLQQSRQELRALAGRLIHAEEEERKRISRELHDDLSQQLALLAIDTGVLLADPALAQKELNDQLLNLQVRVQKLAHTVRQISHHLHPSVLDDLGLVAALSELCEEFSSREGIEVVFEAEGVPSTLPVNIASCLYRISQEALHNTLKHAHPTQTRLKLDATAGRIHLSVRDDGVGFNAEAGSSQPGLGIVSMKERARLVQGEFTIRSQPGEGTEVDVFVPLLKEEA